MRTLKVGLVVVGAVAAVAGCGDAGADSVGAPTIEAVEPTEAPPITRLIEPPEAGADVSPVTAIDAVEIDEPCPANVPVDMNATDSSLIFDEQSRLEPMLGVVLQYGTEYPEQFGGYGLHWLSAGDASVFVSFTEELASHRDALAERVEFPDELIVCQAGASEADRNSIQATLVDELNGRFTSIGSGGKSGRVTVELNANEADLAADLVERYGTAVEVSVGALAYPLVEADAVCQPTLDTNLIDGLDVTIVGTGTELAATPGGTINLTVRLANTSDAPLRFESGQPTATITNESGSPRTLDTRSVADVGIEISIEPGAHRDFDLDVSLASCDPADGYLLPTGEHFIVVSIYNSELQGNMNSAPLPRTVVD